MKTNETKIEQTNPNDVRIAQHSLWEFLKDVQEAIQKGYVLDLETNEHFPQSYGSYYSATLVKDVKNTEDVVVDLLPQVLFTEVEKAIASIPVEPTEPESPKGDAVVKRTRKPKAEAPKVDAEVVDTPAE